MSLAAVGANRIHVLIVDSSNMQSQLLAAALRRKPGFHVLTCENRPAAILGVLGSSLIQVILLDFTPPNHSPDAIHMLRSLHHIYPDIALVPLLNESEPETVINCFRSGAAGVFCFSNSSFRNLGKCIRTVHDGQVWANAQQVNCLVQALRQGPSTRLINDRGQSLLTPREEQVVGLVATGLTNLEISRELKLSQHTIKKYLFHIFDKLGISNRVELVMYAVSHSEPTADGREFVQPEPDRETVPV